MNIYLVKRPAPIDYDNFDSFICAAPDEDTARLLHPCTTAKTEERDKYKWRPEHKGWVRDEDMDPADWQYWGAAPYSDNSWAPPESLTCLLIGKTPYWPGAPEDKPRVILASFNAG